MHIRLLGTFQVLQNGRSLTTFRTDKIRALLAYLAVEADRPHQRESLATLLWPDMEDAKALYNLRLSLHRLRQTLGEAASTIKVDRHTVFFDSTQARVDVGDFIQALTAVTQHQHTHPGECADCKAQLESAVTLYRGEFLPDLYLNEDLNFGEWAAARREYLHREADQTLSWLVRYHKKNGHLLQAILYTRRQLELDPWREPAHRQMMQFLVQTGQYSAALQQYEQCCRLLREEIGVEPEPPTIQLSEKIREEIAKQQRHEKTTRISLSFLPVHHISANLPATAVPFMGRQAELQTLEQFMADLSIQIITIVGAGGIGKTRLALACAATQAAQHPERFPHGVIFVPLTNILTAERLLPAIAQSLPVILDPIETSLSDPQYLLDYLKSRQILLVLDNFEQLLHVDEEPNAIAILSNLVQLAPQLKLLITSRERLQLQAEHHLLLNGLAYSVDSETNSDVGKTPATQLFLHSARRLQPDFTLTADDLPHLTTICRLLDGLPLGLELAAAWVEWLPLAEIASEIQNNLDFLATEFHDWPVRHRSLRSVLDDSWVYLSQPEQRLFSRLSLFRSGFTRVAVQKVAGENRSQTDIIRLLTSLVRKSFLHYNRVIDRYTLHELLHQYGAEQLTNQSDHADGQQQHAIFYCRWLHKQESDLRGERQKEALIHIRTDLENIRMAWSWAAQKGEAALIAKSTFSLGLFFLRNGRFTEGAALFNATQNQLEASTAGDQALAVARLLYWQAIFEPLLTLRQEKLERCLDILENISSSKDSTRADKAAVLLEMGIIAHSQGQHDIVDQSFKQSLTHYRLSDNRWGEANVLFELGVRAWRKGDYPLAEQWFTRCLQLRRHLGDSAGMATVLEGLASTAMFSGNTESARTFLHQSFTVFREVDDQISIARLKIKQAQIDWYQNLEGLALFEESLTSLHNLGARRNEALWTVIYAMLKADEDIEVALQKAVEGQKICLELGHQRGVAIAQGVLSRAALVRGDYTEALALAETYLKTARALSLAVERSDALIWVGWASLALGFILQAKKCVLETLEMPNYWRVACLDLSAVLLAQHVAANYQWAWQIIGYGESRYARHRSVVSQKILYCFLPKPMQNIPSDVIAKLKEEGCHLDETAIYDQIRTTLS